MLEGNSDTLSSLLHLYIYRVLFESNFLTFQEFLFHETPGVQKEGIQQAAAGIEGLLKIWMNSRKM